MDSLSQSNQYQYLFIKQVREQVRKTYKLSQYLKQAKKRNPTFSDKQLIRKVVIQFKSNEGSMIIDHIANKVKLEAQKLSQSDYKRKAWKVDCLRQATSYPFIQNQSLLSLNFDRIYKCQISKDLRRLLWNRLCIRQQCKKQFFQYDHVLSPFNLQQELILYLTQIASKQSIKLKENQKDLAIRLLEYNVKKNKRIPNQNQHYLVLSIVENYSFYTVKKAHQIGAIYVSFLDIAKYYSVTNLNRRFQLILLSISLVDPQTYQLLKSRYFTGVITDKAYQELNQAFESFRLTLGANFLPLQSAYFLIDQLLVKKKHYFDMYIMFAIALMTISDQFQVQPKFIPPFKQVIKKSKQIIQPRDFIDAFNVCYERIPIEFSRENLKGLMIGEKNHLLEKMIEMQQQLEKQNGPVEIPSSKSLSLPKQNGEKGNLSDKFIYEDQSLFRLGERVQKK